MKIVYLAYKEVDETAKKIMDEQKKENEVSVVNLSQNKDYGQIVDLIFSNDKVISWI